MSDVPAPPPAQKPNFLQFIAAHGGGATVDMLTEKMGEIVEHLETLATHDGKHSSKATLSVKITFDRDGGIYKVAVDTAVKLPTVPVPKDVFWATSMHGLVQQDPRQSNLPFRDVNRGGRIVDVSRLHGDDGRD